MERNALEALGRLLNSLGIRWALMGALAANRYRTSPRLTQDVDLLLGGLGPGLEALERALRLEGWSVRRASPHNELLRLRHPELGAADLIVAGTDYEQLALERARVESLGAIGPVHLLTVEDVLILKLIAGRTQDIADIEAILLSAVPVDERYVAEWVSYWEVESVWQRLLGTFRHKS